MQGLHEPDPRLVECCVVDDVEVLDHVTQLQRTRDERVVELTRLAITVHVVIPQPVLHTHEVRLESLTYVSHRSLDTLVSELG